MEKYTHKMPRDEEAFLAPMTCNCLFVSSIERLKRAYHENSDAVEVLQALQVSLQQTDKHFPSLLFNLSKLLLNESQLDIDLQESFLRMQAHASADDMLVPHLLHRSEYRELSERVVALRRTLARIPGEMADRRPFLGTIKEIASSIKLLLDVINAIIGQLPEHLQPGVEKRKREFVHYSKKFSTTLKDFFKTQDAQQVFVVANQLIFHTLQIIRVLRERVHE